MLKQPQSVWVSKDKGHVKDIQGMMRHTRLATTTDVYMQSLESGVRSIINSIHDELKGIVTPGTEPPPTAETQTNREEPRNALAVQNSRAFPQERIRATRARSGVFSAGSWGGFGICDKNATKRKDEIA